MNVQLAPERHMISIVSDELEASVDEFKAAFRNHPAGVALVTADDGHPVAVTVSSVSSISTEPPLLVFSISEASSSSPALEVVDSVVVHLLGADQLPLAKLGATSGVDRFADGTSWYRLATGEPVFSTVATWIRGRVAHRLAAGNSTVYVIHALEAHVPGAATQGTHPLVYHNRTWHRLGDQSAIG